jgi:general secretion pathway protein D
MSRWFLKALLCAWCLIPSLALATPGLTVSSAAGRVGDTFVISVAVADVPADTGLTSWQFDLAFDPAIVGAGTVTEGPFLSSFGSTLFGTGVIDNTTGLISLVTGSYVDLAPNPSGSGVLATITFTALADGFSALTLENVVLGNPDLGFFSPGNSIAGRIDVRESPAVPEPGAGGLLAMAALLIAAVRRRGSAGSLPLAA